MAVSLPLMLVLSMTQCPTVKNRTPMVPRSCDLCAEMGWFFIISTARSGSTTALAMANAIPGFFIAGEERRPIEHGLCEEHFRLPLPKHYRSGLVLPEPHPWPGIFKWIRWHVGAFHQFRSFARDEVGWPDLQHAGELAWWCVAQRLVRRSLGLSKPPRDATVMGRKAVRLQSRHMELLYMLFPCAKFLLTFRNDTEAQVRSQVATFKSFKKQHAGNMPQKMKLIEGKLDDLEARTEDLMAFKARHPESTFAMPLEDVSVDRYNEMLLWLNVQGCKFVAVPKVNANHKVPAPIDIHGLLNGSCTQLSK